MKKTLNLICVANAYVDGEVVKKGKIAEYDEDRGKELIASKRFQKYDSSGKKPQKQYISTEEYDGEGDYHPNKSECKEWKKDMEDMGYTVVPPSEYAKLTQ